MILFEIQPPQAKGAACKIYRDDRLPFMLSVKLKWLAQQEGDLTENLMAHAVDNPDVKKFLASGEGKQETQRWVNYIKENSTPA